MDCAKGKTKSRRVVTEEEKQRGRTIVMKDETKKGD